MRGNLTIDKASMNMSYFLYTVQIIQKHGGKVSRVDFGKIWDNLLEFHQ